MPTAFLDRPPEPTGDGDPTRPGTGPAQRRLATTLDVVDRFSTMAGISFAAITVAGVMLGIAEVGSLSNLFSTGYGQLLLLKVALVGLLVVLAWYNRFLLLPALRSMTGTGDDVVGAAWRRLLSTVRLEAVGLVAVLAVTSVLVNGTPSNGATSLAAPKPFAQSQPFNGGRLELRITPDQAVVNQWTVIVTDAAGRPQDPESVSIYLIEPARNIGPIETDMTRVGPGRFELNGSPDPPVIGQWQIVVQVQVSPFSQLDASFVDTVNL